MVRHRLLVWSPDIPLPFDDKPDHFFQGQARRPIASAMSSRLTWAANEGVLSFFKTPFTSMPSYRAGLTSARACIGRVAELAASGDSGKPEISMQSYRIIGKMQS